ncbi:MAG: FecR domain-containing protein [Verrucomicrobiaceae bacterium]|nr:FecR domain-containing protein [Verrucomicrobiaceae bacterium]
MNEAPPNPPHDRLLELAHGYIERSLNSARIAELETLLSESEEARRVYVDFMHDHATLHWEQIGRDGERGDGIADEDIDEIEDISDYRYSRFPSLWQGFAAAALIALLSLLLLRPPAPAPTFATMKRTEAARWESGPLPTAEGARLGAGELFLVRGIATLDFDSGAEVILEAPARLTLVDAMNCVLTSGTAVAEVGESAEGFTIRTPSARVIDHGTRFAVNVHPVSGATQTQVFDGLVEVALPDGGKSLALRTGQRSVTEGGSLGAVSAAIEEATWTLPEGAEGPQEKNALTLTTAAPGGADAYTCSSETGGHDSETLLLLKNALGENGPHRKSYLRFDLSPIPPGTIAEARLELHFTPTGWGLASNLGDSGFTVYGIRDDRLDDWSGGELDWTTAPANDPDSGTALVAEKVTELGSFVLPRGIQSGSFGIHGEKLAAFLNADANRRASLVIVRDTSEVRGGGLVHAIASSRHVTLPPPALVLRLREDGTPAGVRVSGPR